jgi:uncharacterized protein DUF6069
MDTTTHDQTQRPRTATRSGAVRNSDVDTVRMPRPVEITPADQPPAPRRPRVDAVKLWTGGLATAVVAALIGLVGSLLVRVVAEAAPHGLDRIDTPALCIAAALAALAATGLAHLLLVSTPRPLAYLGWIVGLTTAATAVLPLTSGAPLPTALAQGVLHLVIGLAVGSLVAGAGAAATRPGSIDR